jgi:uncharacterized protein (DUF924 family)
MYADDLIQFWREAGPERWFAKDDAFDAEFRARFLDLHLAAARGELDGRADEPHGALALVDAWADATLAGAGADPAAPALVRATVDALLGVRL